MSEYAYHLVDVFTDVPFGGNPLAVFPLADGLTDALMQTIAKELNLSETAFVMPPTDKQCDYRVRIFTPDMELPMAGHPTVGTAFVLQRQGVITAPSRVTFQEGVGPVPVELALDGDKVAVTMAQPLPAFGAEYDDRAAIADMLSLTEDDLLPDCPVQAVSTGVPFVYVPVKSLDAIGRASVKVDVWQRLLADGPAPHVYVFTLETVHATSTVHSRMFAPLMGIPEDPATGAASGPLGAYLVRYGLAKPGTMINEQGIEMDRPSEIQIGIDWDGDAFTGVRVGGRCVYMGHGVLHIVR